MYLFLFIAILAFLFIDQGTLLNSYRTERSNASKATAETATATSSSSPQSLPTQIVPAGLISSSSSQFSLPAGFTASVFASGLVNPRVITFDTKGTMLVSITNQGKILALPDKNKNGKADSTVTLLRGLKTPHGIVVHCIGSSCLLYVAEANQLSSYKYDPVKLKATGRKKLLSLPGGGRHTTRSLLLIKDGRDDVFLISIGSSCDTCREKDPRRGSIVSYNLRSGQSGIYARGLRNAVFLTTNPEDGRTWVTEMGRDYLGNNLPPDEINIIEKGKNYGWPICYGKNIHDTVFDKNTYIRNPCMEPFETPSLIDIPSHSAPLGLSFIPSEGWPAEYRGNLIVAYHGSWNRNPPTGYKLVRNIFDENGNYLRTEDFMTGFLKNGPRLGRPAGVVALPNGIIFLADDMKGIIYRIKYDGGAA